MQFVPLWTCILKSKKVGKMPPDVFRFWVFCLVSAQENDARRGILPRLDDLAYSLHMNEREAESLMSRLVTIGFVDEHDDCYSIHDWQDWKYRPDTTAAERKRKQRAKMREPGSNGNVTDVTDVTENHACHALTEINRDEINREGAPLPPVTIRPPEDSREFDAAIGLLRCSLQTEPLGLELSRNSGLPEVLVIEGWKWLNAARVICSGKGPPKWSYLLGTARSTTREEFESRGKPPAGSKKYTDTSKPTNMPGGPTAEDIARYQAEGRGKPQMTRAEWEEKERALRKPQV